MFTFAFVNILTGSKIIATPGFDLVPITFTATLILVEAAEKVLDIAISN